MSGLCGIQKIGRFELVRCLGEGAFGTVYLGFDPTSKQKVALKIPVPESTYSPETLESSASEFDVCKTFDHPGIIPIYESGIASGTPFVANEYIDGPTLADWLDADQPLPTWKTATRFLIKVATAIASIHEHGILHGDLKPANIFLQKTRQSEASDLPHWNPKISYFGFASQQRDGKWPYRNGIPLGSPRYLAPELYSNPDSPLSPAVDAYSFGIMMFEVLAGQHPFETRFQPSHSLLKYAPRLPSSLHEVVQGCIRKEPSARYHSFPDLVATLRSLVP